MRIAIEAHEGQKDLDGKPAVLHPVAVGLMGSNDAETKTGFLHDAVEDSDLTMDELRGRGVDEDVLAALQLLTHAKTEDYFDFWMNCAAEGSMRMCLPHFSCLRTLRLRTTSIMCVESPRPATPRPFMSR